MTSNISSADDHGKPKFSVRELLFLWRAEANISKSNYSRLNLNIVYAESYENTVEENEIHSGWYQGKYIKEEMRVHNLEQRKTNIFVAVIEVFNLKKKTIYYYFYHF